MDLYRISEPRQLEELNLREYLYSGGVAIVEWFERLPAEELRDHLKVLLEHGQKNERRLILEAHGALYEKILERLRVDAKGRNRGLSWS
jgi:tRNA A37 threonylcarbamoyladenosine biosynthesis protein TsaE